MSMQVAGHQTEGYKINTPVYTGPLDLLLGLIEKAELDITSLSLAQVTDQYLDYLSQIVDRDPAEVSAFLVMAARLVQIKSAALLPRPVSLEPNQEIDDAEALARQLILYRRFKQISAWLEERQEAGLRTHLRLAAPETHIETHLDMSGMTISDLVKAAWDAMGIQDSLPALDSVVNMPRITIRERILAIIETLKVYGKTNFHEILQNRNRLEVVVTFLAMLELIKRNAIQAEQGNLFGTITLQSIGNLDEEQDVEIEFLD